MAQFASVTYSGSYSGSGSGTDEDGSFSIITNGTLTAILSQDAAGNISGTWSYSGSATASWIDFAETFSVRDSGTVSGTAANVTYLSSGGVFVNGSGSLTSSNTSLSFSASFIFDGGSGGAGGNLTGSPPTDVPVTDVPDTTDTIAAVTFTTIAPDTTTWDESSVVQASGVFVSPQYTTTVDETTGTISAWSLKSYPGTPGGIFNAKDVDFFVGIATDKLADKLGDAAQSKIDTFIRQKYGEQKADTFTELFKTTKMATDYYDAVSKLADTTMGILADAPQAVVGLSSPDALQARIDAAHLQFSEDLAAILLPGYVTDAVKGVKWFLQRSDYSFGMQTSSGAYVGNEHRDTFLGGIENDSFSGGANDDMALGGKGRDTLTGDSGNDILDGGEGLDTAIYNGAWANHTITKNSSGFTIVDGAGTNGTDSVLDIERLRFDDKSIAIDIDGNAGKAYRLYQAAFDRAPDLPGLGYWIDILDQGYDFYVVAYTFFTSDEFKTLYGSNTSHADLITLLYQNVLHRTPDQEGFDYWLNLLNTSQVSPIQVLVEFSESVENKAQVIGVIQNGIEYTPWIG